MPLPQRLLGNAALVLLGVALSNAAGFLREVVVAALLGAGRQADTFFIALTLPEFLFLLLPLAVGPALLPLLAEKSLRQGIGEAARLLGAVTLALALLLDALAAAAIVAAPLYLPLLAPGFYPAALDQSARLTRIMLPAVPLMGLAAVLSAALNARRRFFLPAVATAGYNAAFVVVALLAGERLGIHALAWGVLIGAGAAMALQLPQTFRLYGRSWIDSWRHPATRRFLALAAPLALGFLVHYVATLVDRAMASTLAGGTVAALNYSYRTAMVPGQLIGMAVSTAIFPEAAELAAAGRHRELRQTLATGLRWIALAGLPAAAGLTLLRQPVVRLLFQRGAFDQAATTMTSSLLAWYAWGVLFDALCQPLWRVLYARQEMWLTVGVNGLKTALRVLLDLALLRAFAYTSLAVSFVLGFAVQLAVLLVLVRRRLR